MPWWRRWSHQITFEDALGRGVRTLDEAVKVGVGVGARVRI